MHCHGSYLPMSEARSAPHACSFAFHPPLPDSQIEVSEPSAVAGRWARHENCIISIDATIDSRPPMDRPASILDS